MVASSAHCLCAAGVLPCCLAPVPTALSGCCACSAKQLLEFFCATLTVHSRPLQVADDIRALHALAQRRRAARQAAGALRLDNTKLDFQLDDRGQPIGCTPHEQR